MGILGWENPWKRGSTERGTNCGYNELYHIVSVSKSSQEEEHRANLNPTTMIRASPTSTRSRSTRWKVAAARSFGQTSSPGGGDSSRLQLRNPYECRIVQLSRPKEIDLQERMDPRLVPLRRAPYR